VIIELKHYLESNRSKLLKNLMDYIKEIVKDFRVEMEDIFASDRQLAKEIEFDLKNSERVGN
jgi:condensin-2 complex subunit D3